MVGKSLFLILAPPWGALFSYSLLWFHTWYNFSQGICILNKASHTYFILFPLNSTPMNRFPTPFRERVWNIIVEVYSSCSEKDFFASCHHSFCISLLWCRKANLFIGKGCLVVQNDSSRLFLIHCTLVQSNLTHIYFLATWQYRPAGVTNIWRD